MQLTAIVLAGGKSSRMGRDKCLITSPDGTLMIENIINVFSQLTGRILINANNPQSYLRFGHPVIADTFKNCGPLCGIFTGLSASTTEINLFAPCDMPFLTAEFYQFLLEQINGYDAVVPEFDGKIYPICSVLKKSTQAIALGQIQKHNYRVRDFLRLIKVKYIDVRTNSRIFSDDLLMNVNTPADLQRYFQQIKQQK